MTPKWEILQLAYELAFNAVMKPDNFNPELATYSLQIFVGLAVRTQEVDAAQSVLDALQKLAAIAWADRRSRVWQERKVLVQDAFSYLASVYDETSNVEAFRQTNR